MSEIDRQRVSAVRMLEATGHTYREGRWQQVGGLPHWPEDDAMHSLLIQRADVLIGCTDGSADQDELEAIGEALEAYEALRWPDGKADGGKG